VELVCYGSEGLLAVEVKNTARLGPADFRGLRAFGEDYPQCRRLLLYRGSARLQRDKVLCLPVTEFLSSLLPSRNIFED
jgi:uncharacterized protein